MLLGTEGRTRFLLFGYGNPGRLDDGLGPAFIEAFEGRDLENVTLDADYQLTVEDAAAVAEHDVAIFVDASVNGAEPFFFEKLTRFPLFILFVPTKNRRNPMEFITFSFFRNGRA